MKDVLTALTAEIFKPLMTVLLPGAVAASTFITYLFLKHQQIRNLADLRRLETSILLTLLALVIGEILEDVGSRVEYGFDSRLKNKTDKPEYLNFEANWWSYLRFKEQPGPIGIRYIRTHVIRLKFELGMAGAFLLTTGGIWLLPVSRCTSIVSSLGSLSLSVYFWWEASDTHDLLAKVRHEIFGAGTKEATSTVAGQ